MVTVTGTGEECVTGTAVAVNITRTGTDVDWNEIHCRILLCGRGCGGLVVEQCCPDMTFVFV